MRLVGQPVSATDDFGSIERDRWFFFLCIRYFFVQIDIDREIIFRTGGFIYDALYSAQIDGLDGGGIRGGRMVRFGPILLGRVGIIVDYSRYIVQSDRVGNDFFLIVFRPFSSLLPEIELYDVFLASGSCLFGSLTDRNTLAVNDGMTMDFADTFVDNMTQRIFRDCRTGTQGFETDLIVQVPEKLLMIRKMDGRSF